MSLAERIDLPSSEAPGGASACPACLAAPSAERLAAMAGPAGGRLVLSLPTAHCAACMTTVEGGLEKLAGVRSARVNLTLRRVSVDAEPEVTAAQLVEALSRLGYEAHELDAGMLSATETDRQGRDLLMRLGVAGFSMMNVMLLSVAVWSGAEAATRDLFHWISAAIALPTVVFAGQPFFRNAWTALRAGRLGMDVPISLAIILASSISLFETFHSGHHAYFDAAVMLTFFLLAGRYLDHRTRAVARSAAEELAALEVPRAMLLRDGEEVTVPIAELAAGDLVRVRPGGRMPVDGVVAEGFSELDRSLLTGESLPVPAGPETVVSAGEVNLTGPLTVRVTAAGRDSSLHRMADLVAVAESAKTRYTSLAERASRLYSPLVHILSFTAFGGLDVDHEGRRAHLDQHLGRRAHHHLPLRPGARRARRGDGGERAALPQGAAHQGRHRAGTSRRGGYGRLRQDRHADAGHARAHQSRDASPGGSDAGGGAGRVLGASSGHGARARRKGGRGCSPRPSPTCAKCRASASRAGSRAAPSGSAAPNGWVLRPSP